MDGNYELYPSNPIEAQLFEKGYEYAIKRAVKWLERYASDYAFSIYDDEDACSVDDRIIDDFKKAMLEE